MYVKTLKLIDFRNYPTAEIVLGEGINVLTGKNAQGKTNLTEAIYLCCVGRSPRTKKDKELIRWEQKAAYVRVEAEKKYGRVKVEAYLTQTENKRVSINGMPINKIGELMGNINCVYFSPDELAIVKDGPSARRKFLDVDNAQLSKAYFYDLARFNQIIAQRNKLLKSGKATDDTLYIWDVQLSEIGAKLIYARRAFSKKLAAFGKETQAYLSDGKETLEVGYESIDGETIEEIRTAYMRALTDTHARDMYLGYTTQGPHKDDLSLIVNGVDIRSYGSQGQQRTVAIALKLAELEIFSHTIGEYPLLILDDVMSELDPSRQLKLLERIRRMQTIVTCTHLETDYADAKIFRVDGGTVTEEQPRD